MAASDPLDILLRHDHWASRQILGACQGLTPEQFQQKFDLGPGSLHDTLVHMVGAMRAWTDVLEQREMRPRPEGGAMRSPAEVMGMLDLAAAELSQVARRHGVEGTVTRVRDGKTYTFTRGAVVTHVTTHGMHHRAQCLNMLRRLGVSPLPKSSVSEWTLEGDAA